MTITALPIPPSRQDPTNFSERADAFMAALPTFATETNATAVDVDADAVSAAASAVNAAASAAGANASANVSKWVSGTTYAQGAVVWSPVNYFSYRRKVAGAGATDPTADGTNWALVSGAGDVSLTGVQTLTNKTLTSPTLNTPIVNSANLISPALGTPTSGILTNCTFPTLNQNTTGNAATATTATTATTAAACTGNAATATKLSNDNGSAPSYSCRAWVNFNGTGTVAIRANGNVSSITDNGTGDYTINFTTPMVDANYSCTMFLGITPTTGGAYGFMPYELLNTNQALARTVSSIRVGSLVTSFVPGDSAFINVAIFR